MRTALTQRVSASPPKAREFTLPNCGRVTGMGVPIGITLIVGGGFHGKSTLLKALEVGVYNHVPGDGRELVVTDSTAYKAGGCLSCLFIGFYAFACRRCSQKAHADGGLGLEWRVA